MAVLTPTGITVTHDESAGLQNFNVVGVPSDADDNDTSLALPSAFSTRLTALLSATTGTEVLIGTALSGYDATHLTGQNVLTVSAGPGGTITGLAFTGSNGAPLDGLVSGKFTADGDSILLYTDSTNNNILVARAGSATGDIVFAAYLEETFTGSSITGAKIWVVQYEALAHGNIANPDDALNLLNLVYVSASQDTEFSLANAPSGQNLFLMFTKANPTIVNGRITDVTIIATGKDPANQSGADPNSTADDINISTGDTVNTSQAGGPTTFGTNSQMITEQEGIRFTFVTGARADVTIPNLDQTEADLESNIDFTGMFGGVRTAEFDIVQLQSGKSAQVKITAYSTAVESGVNFIDGYANDATVPIVSVRVLDSVTNAVLETFANGTEGGLSSALTITITGGVALVTGVTAGHTIEYTTSADHNRVLVQNGAALDASGNTHADFDIGGFRLLQVSTETVEVGSKMIFEDDGPSIVVADIAAADALTVDETVLATNATANFADNFSSTPNYGADGAGTVSSAYALSLKTSGADSGLDDVATGNSVFLFLNAGVVQGREGTDATDAATGDIVFTVSVSATGTVTLDQQRAVVHPNTSNPDDSVTLAAADLIVLTRTDTITDSEGDPNTGSDFLNIGQALNFEDDGPSIVVADVAAADTLTVDETILTTNASANFADNFSSTPSYGADGAGTVSSAYALSVKTSGADSGLDDVATGNSVFLFLNAGVVQGREGTDATDAATGDIVFTVSVSATGTVTLDQQRAVVHPNTSNPDDSVTLAAADLIVLTRTDTITDKDGDQNTGSDFLNIGQALNFEDDGPTILARTDLIYSNTSNPSPGGTGIFDYAIGADARSSFSASNSDFSTITLTGTVGTAAITSPTVTWSSETSTSASFLVTFNYQPDPNSTNTSAATGTLSFDKVNGTYTFALNAPVSGFNTVTTGQALGFTGYTAGTQTVDHTQPDVSVAQLSSNFFVQFTGYSEPGGGTGANNLQALAPADALGTASGGAFVNGELFKQATTWVSVSNLANGVAGDTIQQGEVLDLDFFTSNPFGITTATPTTQASGMFLKFDGIGSEDLVVVLKLVDPDDNTRTTKAIIIDNSDILKSGDTIPAPYNIVLDNNDGAVIIESNDFNTGTQNYLIEGAQLLVSTEGVTGTAINLNPVTGSSGGSSTFQEFSGTPGTANPEAATSDNDVIKISDIGFVTVSSGQLDANLHFSLAVKDADGDATATQVLDVSIVGGTTFTGGADDETIQGSAGNDTLIGGAGNDTLIGAAGNDTLIGGLGTDTLIGGDGSDVYDFNSVAESPAGAGKDVISGFVSGADKVDLAGIDAVAGGADDAFTYLGSGAFTNVAGQLRFDVASSTLQGDVDGNGVADFEVQLTGIVAAPPLGDIVV